MKTDELKRMEHQYKRGYQDGLRAYAYWKNGVQYVGTTGRTLEQALSDMEDTWNFLLPLGIIDGEQERGS